MGGQPQGLPLQVVNLDCFVGTPRNDVVFTLLPFTVKTGDTLLGQGSALFDLSRQALPANAIPQAELAQ